MNWAQRKLDSFNLDWWFLTVSLPWHPRHCCSATHPSLAKCLRKPGSRCPGKGEAGGQAVGQARSWGWGSGIREGCCMVRLARAVHQDLTPRAWDSIKSDWVGDLLPTNLDTGLVLAAGQPAGPCLLCLKKSGKWFLLIHMMLNCS